MGRVILMFQPSEENGRGAAAVIADPKFKLIKPDWVFSLHNAPGLEFATAKLAFGPANCASRGIRIRLAGRTAHAASPADGLPPMRALSQLMTAFEELGSGKVLGTP